MPTLESSIFFAKRMVVDNIWRSANIEGLGTTFPDTQAIYNGLPTNTTFEESAFITGMKHGWEYLFNTIGEPINLMFVRNLHEISCRYMVQSPGDLRTGSVRISGCSYIPDIPNTDEVFHDLQQINAISNPIDKALVSFCYLSRNQIFWDGNKRIAQLIANKVLIENCIGILSVGLPKCNVCEFTSLLCEYYDSNNPSKLMKYLYNSVEYIPN